MAKGYQGKSRSFDKGTDNLIGSHMNQLSSTDVCGSYWFSRLLEYFEVKLCIGGHKHTYAATFPLREYYITKDGHNSKDHRSSLNMSSDLSKDDKIVWVQDGVHTSKQPLIWETSYSDYKDHKEEGSLIHVLTKDNTSNLAYKGVVYWMLQATGYKLTSNKELPSRFQEFSQIIPETTDDNKASSEQKYPMFAEIECADTYKLSLIRIANVMNMGNFGISVDVPTDTPKLQYCVEHTKSDLDKRWKA